MSDNINGERFGQYIEHICDEVMVLKIYTNNSDLKEKYNKEIKLIQQTLITASYKYVNTGFDIYLPNDIHKYSPDNVYKVNFEVKCRADIYKFKYPNIISPKSYPSPFYLYPKIINTSYLRAVSGNEIIDTAYRGDLMYVFEYTDEEPNRDNNLEKRDTDVIASKFDRLLQIRSPNLIPIFPILVETEEGLGESTERSASGFWFNR